MRFPTHRAHELYAAAEHIANILGNPEALETFVDRDELIDLYGRLIALADLLSHPSSEACVDRVIAQARDVFSRAGGEAMFCLRAVDEIGTIPWEDERGPIEDPDDVISETPVELRPTDHLVLAGLHARLIEHRAENWDDRSVVFANSAEALDSPDAFHVRSLAKLRDLISAMNIVIELSHSASGSEERAANVRFAKLGVRFYN